MSDRGGSLVEHPGLEPLEGAEVKELGGPEIVLATTADAEIVADDESLRPHRGKSRNTRSTRSGARSFTDPAGQ